LDHQRPSAQKRHRAELVIVLLLRNAERFVDI
jgi:hypothetical protein